MLTQTRSIPSVRTPFCEDLRLKRVLAVALTMFRALVENYRKRLRGVPYDNETLFENNPYEAVNENTAAGPRGTLASQLGRAIVDLDLEVRPGNKSPLWIAIVETDTVFSALHGSGRSGICDRIGPAILLTGRGFPDEAILQPDDQELNSHLYGLFDGDPHGVTIDST
ncbi:hypothetical protein IAR50_002810 [Cryptococcus sp. DSM 104548]